MDAPKTAGIIIILILIFSIGLVGYNSYTSLENDEQNNMTSEILTADQVTQLFNNSANNTISTVDINLNQKTGGAEIRFEDTDNIYNITSESQTNQTTDVSYTADNGTVNVNIDSNDTDNVIILSNKYVYNINGQMSAGGINTEIGNNSHVNSLNLNITLGGITLNLDGGSIDNINTNINTGGVNIMGTPHGTTTVNSHISVGGINIDLDNPVAHIYSTTNVGGTSAEDYQKISDIEYKSSNFDSSNDKIIINSYVDVGGLYIQ